MHMLVKKVPEKEESWIKLNEPLSYYVVLLQFHLLLDDWLYWIRMLDSQEGLLA